MIHPWAGRPELAMLMTEQGLLRVQLDAGRHHGRAGHAGHIRRHRVRSSVHRRAGISRHGDLREQDHHRQQADQANAEGSGEQHGSDDSRNTLAPLAWARAADDSSGEVIARPEVGLAYAVLMPSQTATLEPPPSRPPARIGRQPQVPPDLNRWSASPDKSDYVTITIAAAITGYSVKAIRRKIEAGVWLEGREFRRASDGHVPISVKGYELWVERGRA